MLSLKNEKTKEEAEEKIKKLKEKIRSPKDVEAAKEKAIERLNQKIEKLNDHVFLQFWCLKFHQQVHD